MKVYRFEIFNIVAKVKSFSKAAKLLYLSQPSVSKHIQFMESYYGNTLFHRTNNGVFLTSAGEKVYEYSKKILQMHNELEQEMNNYLDQEKQNLYIGASITPGNYLLPCTIWRFKDKHPHIETKLDINATPQIIEKVVGHEVDIGVVEGEVPKDLDIYNRVIFTDQLQFIASPKQYSQDTFTLEELKDLPLILLNNEFGIRQRFNKIMESIHINPKDLNIVTEIGSISGIKAALEFGLGVSLVSYSSVKKEVYQNILKIITIQGLPKIDLDFKLLYHHQDGTKPSIISKFIALINMEDEEIFC